MAAPLTPIPGLRLSVLYETTVAIYLRHRQATRSVRRVRTTSTVPGETSRCPRDLVGRD